MLVKPGPNYPAEAARIDGVAYDALPPPVGGRTWFWAGSCPTPRFTWCDKVARNAGLIWDALPLDEQVAWDPLWEQFAGDKVGECRASTPPWFGYLTWGAWDFIIYPGATYYQWTSEVSPFRFGSSGPLILEAQEGGSMSAVAAVSAPVVLRVNWKLVGGDLAPEDPPRTLAVNVLINGMLVYTHTWNGSGTEEGVAPFLLGVGNQEVAVYFVAMWGLNQTKPDTGCECFFTLGRA